MSTSHTLAGLRILVLEDEYLIAMDVEQLCRDHGAEEVTISRGVPNAEEEEMAYDLAVVDVMLGGTSTLPFARSLLERKIPFVFTTGYAASDQFADFPNVRIIGKPYGADELMEALIGAAAEVGPRRG